MKSFETIQRNQAFTLIEMLTVVTIMALLIGMTATAVQSSMKSQNLSNVARQFCSDLDYAVLLAKKSNRPVDILLYEFEPAELGGAKTIRAYQCAILEGFNTDGTPQYKFLVETTRFPNGLTVLPSAEYSTLTKLPKRTSPPQAGGGVVETYEVLSYQIRPDGTTSLTQDQEQTLTFVWENQLQGSSLPADYRTVAINPLTARARVY